MGQDARQNSETLAKKLKLSPATVRRRLRKLTRSGLLRIVGVIDPTKYGYPLTVVFALDVAQGKLGSAIMMLAKYPEIRWLSATTGRFDIIAWARFASTDSLSKFLTEQLPQLDGVKDSETFIGLDVKKGNQIVSDWI